MTATEPLLDIADLHIAFGSKKESTEVVHGVSLAIYPGETVAIVGESGSGKSTTAHAIASLLPGTGLVTKGTISFEGQDITHLGSKASQAIRGSQIGLVPQDPMSNLNPVWKVGFQLEETLAANGIARGRAAKKRAVELLTEAGLPDAETRLGQYPHEFSGGMKQRALIAIGLAARPKLLIADEPTSALDVTVQQQILDHLESLTSELGTAVLLITHDLGLAAERAQRVVVMHQGLIVEQGPALEVLQRPQHPYTKRLIQAAPSLRAQRQSVVEARAEVREEAVQVAQEQAAAEGVESLSAPLLEVQGVTKEFKLRGGAPWKSSIFTAVDDANFAIDRGTTTAIVGESGSGKSTIARMVLGLLEPTRGQVRFDGQDVAQIPRSGQLAFRRRVQPVFQNPYGSLDPMYSIYRTIDEPLRIHGLGSAKERRAKVIELLDQVALPSSFISRFPNELSGGQRQRVAIARALALNPELIVLDEAVSALDVLVQAQVLDLLGRLQAELGLTYLFITHDLAVVRQIADQVVVMEAGKIVERAGAEEIFDRPQTEYTRTLISSIPGGSIELAGKGWRDRAAIGVMPML